MKIMSIIIRPITAADFPVVLNWSKDDLFCLANGWERNRTSEELFSWWQRCVANPNKDFYRVGIESNERLIGYCDLANVQGNLAEIGIAIGESISWGGKGFGSTALILMMEYATENLGITIFTAETHETNFRAQNMLIKVGFIEVSRKGTEIYQGKDTGLIQYKKAR